jgi:hypothetical protein
LSQGQAVLIFCQDGVSRSSALAIAYLMYAKRKTFAQANSFVQLKRSKAKPNFGFVKQLLAFEQSLQLKGDMGTSKPSSITRNLLKTSQTELSMYRGLSPGAESITNLASKVGSTVGVKVPGQPTGSILESKTPISKILRSDMTELQARNAKMIGFSPAKLAN